MFESSKLHCRLHCLGVEVTNWYRGHVFRLGPCFFFPFHKPNYYECAFFLAKPTTHARVVRHTILKRNGKKKPWAQTNNSLPNNHVRHNEASFNSTKWRCPYDNVTYCKFTPNRKQLPKQLPPPLHMARTWMDMHRLRRLHDSQYIMKNPFTNENSNLSNIFHNNIHRKKVESLKVRSTEEFLCQFAWLPCRFFRGRRQGRQPLNIFFSLCWQLPRDDTAQIKRKSDGFLWCIPRTVSNRTKLSSTRPLQLRHTSQLLLLLGTFLVDGRLPKLTLHGDGVGALECPQWNGWPEAQLHHASKQFRI